MNDQKSMENCEMKQETGHFLSDCDYDPTLNVAGIPETVAIAERDDKSFCWKCYYPALRLLKHGASMERQRNDAKQIARDLCETISYLAPDLLDRHGYTFEKAAVMRCLEMLNEDPEGHFRNATKEAAK